MTSRRKFLLTGLKRFMQAPVPHLYSGRAKKMTPVYMESFASLQDQPEQRYVVSSKGKCNISRALGLRDGLQHIKKCAVTLQDLFGISKEGSS